MRTRKRSEAWEEAEAAMLPVAGELDAANNQYAEAKKKARRSGQRPSPTRRRSCRRSKRSAEPFNRPRPRPRKPSKPLPEDKELAEAAQKFVAASQQLAAEVAALAKAVEEKTAAVAPTTEAWNKHQAAGRSGACEGHAAGDGVSRQAEKTMLAGASTRRRPTPKRWPRSIAGWKPPDDIAKLAGAESGGRRGEASRCRRARPNVGRREKLLAEFAATSPTTKRKAKAATDAIAAARERRSGRGRA